MLNRSIVRFAILVTGFFAADVANAETVFLRSYVAQAAYKEKYETAQGHKAFAQSLLGSWAWIANQSNEAVAKEIALAQCNARVSVDEPPCVIVDINGEAEKGSTAEEHTLITQFIERYIATILKAAELYDMDRFHEIVLRLGRLPFAPGKTSAHALNEYSWGMKYLKEGNLNDAITSFRNAVSEAPGMYSFHNGYVLALLNAGKYQEADAALGPALRLSPANRATWTMKAIALSHLGMRESADSALLAAYELASDKEKVFTTFKEFSETEADPVMRDSYKAVVHRISSILLFSKEDSKKYVIADSNTNSCCVNPNIPQVDFATCPKPTYPLSSQRDEEQGTVSFAFLIGENGRILDTVLVQSSGSSRLDGAAKLSLSTCKFLSPSNPNIKQAWVRVSHVWALK